MNKRTIQISLCLFLGLLSLQAYGQDVHFVELGVNGLHCSACSFTVEKSIKKVDGVSVVQMDLNQRAGKIFFADGMQPSLVDLAKAVSDAGYSVRFLKLHFREAIDPKETCHWQNYCFKPFEEASASWQLLGKLFLPKKEWKNKVVRSLIMDCTTCEENSYLINSGS